MRTSTQIKYKKFFPTFVSNKAYLGPCATLVDKSLHPFLLGKRGGFSYYDLQASFLGVKDSLDVLENVVIDRGKIFFVGGTLSFVSVLLCLPLSPESGVKVGPWDFSQITKTKGFDFMFLHEIDKKAILESQGKTIPFVGVGSTSVAGISYPFNLNVEESVLANWYLYAVINSCRRGMYRRVKLKNNEI
uniref:ribosomal protein S2 n=1 Tax=Microzonia abyssicola TaxID=217214 RepID=UPI002E75BCFA|nr:ribosomal protein S2 [Syringoderma abyssicola]WBP70360.1 ribosomal protein S2 [Syringoderma abyssicola]